MSQPNTTYIPRTRRVDHPSISRAVRALSAERRNVVRGLVSKLKTVPLTVGQIDTIRNNRCESDMSIAATLLESPNGLKERRIHSLVDTDLELVHYLKTHSPREEAAYTCGFLNSWKSETIKAISTVELLAQITAVDQLDALNALLTVAKSWGSSAYLARKIAYAKVFFSDNQDVTALIAQIDAALEHKENPHIQFQAIELIKDELSLFTVAKRHINVLQKVTKGDFRSSLSLSGLVATPIDELDCAAFLLRAVQTSLIDAIHAVWIVFRLRDRFANVVSALERSLDPDILEHLIGAQLALDAKALPALLQHPQHFPDGSPKLDEFTCESLQIYRRSSTFLEFAPMCTLRNDIDRVIGHRLMASLMPPSRTWTAPAIYEKSTLCQMSSDNIGLSDEIAIPLDTFSRTYLFLRFIQDNQNISTLSNDEFRFIFDRTMGLESLLQESELRTMHLNASDAAKALVSVLAMALYRSKSSDPDIDFDFRERLEEYVRDHHNGSLADFVDHLAPQSPEVAKYIAASLDEATLQKMYTIISSIQDAERTRQAILMSLGRHLNRLEYIVEAEGIETRAKVSRLRDYFDASRLYVDSIAMSKWLSSNPSAYTQQFKENLPRMVARLSAAKTLVTSNGEQARFEMFEIGSTDEYLITEMAKEAFREFCINNEFGIESYLGRRIRHNTLHGVITNSVDAVLQRSDFHAILAGTPFGRSVAAWESNLRVFIERMRREFLQFRSDSKPNALFNSSIDVSDAATKRNIQALVQSLRVSGIEMLDELIVSFCWRQVAPQLEAASRSIRVSMAQDMIGALDHFVRDFEGPEERKIVTMLNDAISSVFAKVGSWFQVPQTGFVPASVSDICKIIDLENGRVASSTAVVGDDVEVKYLGISVHRLYDCLAVLLQNAFKHGAAGAPVSVRLDAGRLAVDNLDLLEVRVCSVLPELSDSCVGRVEAAVNSTDTGREMVTEGYSGIKKVKFITRLNEGQSTAFFAVNGNKIEVGFRLKAEKADVVRQEVGGADSAN